MLDKKETIVLIVIALLVLPIGTIDNLLIVWFVGIFGLQAYLLIAIGFLLWMTLYLHKHGLTLRGFIKENGKQIHQSSNCHETILYSVY